MLTKKNVFAVSAVISIVLLVLNSIGTFKVCGANSYGSCMTTLANVMRILLPAIPVAILSGLSFFVRDEIFRSWTRFALWWVPLTMFLTLISPEYGNALAPIDKGTVSFGMSAVFVIVSLGIIVVRSVQLRGR